jgi:hypothetical protein
MLPDDMRIGFNIAQVVPGDMIHTRRIWEGGCCGYGDRALARISHGGFRGPQLDTLRTCIDPLWNQSASSLGVKQFVVVEERSLSR